MKTLIVAMVLGTGIWVAGAWLTARPASCDWCVATFCGNSSECPGNCVCAIPFGEATGRCTGTR